MGLSNATIGLVGGFIVLPLPQMLAAQGVPEMRIAAISAACLSPGFWVFLLGPLLDIRFTRRTYATLFATLAGFWSDDRRPSAATLTAPRNHAHGGLRGLCSEFKRPR